MLCWLPMATCYILTLAWSPNLHSLRTLVSLLLRLPFVWLLFRIARYVFLALLSHTLAVRSETSHEYVSPWPPCLQNNFSVKINIFILPDAPECTLICIHVVRGIDGTNIRFVYFILSTFSHVVSSWSYVASSGMVKNKNWTGKDWKNSVQGLIWRIIPTFVWGDWGKLRNAAVSSVSQLRL